MTRRLTSWRLARAGITLVTVVVLVVSGAYLLIYLYRWQWNRAVVSGIFFIASLLIFTTARILEALRRLDRRLDDLDAATRASEQLATDSLRAGGAASADRHFAWLEDPGRLGVFIPVLLGAGVVLSALTWVLERLAGALAGATIDPGTARLLAPDLPLGPMAAPRVEPPGKPSGSVAGRTIGGVAAVATAVLLLGASIYVLREATMSRPDTTSLVGQTSVELTIRRKGVLRDPEPVAEALWVTCRGRLSATAKPPRIDVLATNRVEMVFDTRLGELRRRRFFGCLEDLSVDLVQARVISFTVSPELPADPD